MKKPTVRQVIKKALNLPNGARLLKDGTPASKHHRLKQREVVTIQWPVEHGTEHVTFRGGAFQSGTETKDKP